MSNPQTESENMDQEQGKRKAEQSPEARKTGSGPRANKIKKPNPPETSLLKEQVQTQTQMQINTQPPMQTQTQIQTETQTPVRIQSSDRSRSFDMVQKLVAAWTGGAEGQYPLMTQESVRESTVLRDSQQQCTEYESMIQMLQQRIQGAGNVISNLKSALRAEGKEKMELIDKINTTDQLTSTISDHINYITDTLGRCQKHKNHLSKLYDSVILKQKEDYARLKSEEKNVHDQSMNLQDKVVTLEKTLEIRRHTDENKWQQIQQGYKTELATIRKEHETVKKQLAEIANEKKEVAQKLAIETDNSKNLEKKIIEYDNEVKKLITDLSRVSENLQSLQDEKNKFENQLAEKDRNTLRIIEELESATKKITELSAEISMMSDEKNDLEKKLTEELSERENLLKDLNARNEALVLEVESMKESKEEALQEMQRRNEEAIEEMKKSIEESTNELQRSKEKVRNEMQMKIDVADKEIQRILTENNNGNDELKEKYERQLKIQVEKYESCMAEIKTMEARHKCELSRTTVSSSTSLATANAEKRQMEREFDTLRREKERLEVEWRQAEDLLRQHTTSEKLLQKKLEQAQSEATKYASAAATAAAEKKRLDEDKQESICKIKELEKELLNLQFNNAKKPNETPKPKTGVDEDNREKEKPKKPTIVASNLRTTMKKSCLKRQPTQPRRTRSSPPSPTTLQPPQSTEKKITFNLGDSSDSSPIKLNDTALVNKIINSDTLFDEMIGVGKSSSQPMQAALVNSQVSMSQVSTGGRKFFKSRSSQAK